jgi:thiopeptide-type bacteriocin biosynthesis protein
MNEWMEANIYVHEGKQNEILLRFIKPLVEKLRSEFKITAYHFLHEPDNEIRFRVLTNSDNIEKVIGLINNAKGMLQVRDIKYPEHPYAGEKDAFGEDGLRTTYKYLEAGSDFALDLIDPNAKKGPQFNIIAFSHYILNQSGLNILQEANFHATVANERMSVILTLSLQELGNRLMEKITQLETRIGQLEKQNRS